MQDATSHGKVKNPCKVVQI